MNNSNINLFSDLINMLDVIIWPSILLIILVIYRKQIIILVGQLQGSLEKISIGNVSLEFAKADKAATIQFESSIENIRKPEYSQIDDSTMGSFIEQLKDTRTSDYAIVDIGNGDEWLTSRLYILSIVLERIKGIKYFVFVESHEDTFKRFIGIADAHSIRWALASHYTWFEKAFAQAYSLIHQYEIKVNIQGGIYEKINPTYPQLTIDIVNQFLQNIQNDLNIAGDSEHEWVELSASQVNEHAEWISRETLEKILGEKINRAFIESKQFESKPKLERIKEILLNKGDFVALVDSGKRFEHLIDRKAVAERMLANLTGIE